MTSYNDWVTDTLQLAFRLDTAFQQIEAHPFVDAYYGPPALREAAAAGPPPDAGALLADAQRLAATLADQHFPPRRDAYLHVQIRSLEAFCHLLAGQKWPVRQAARACLGVDPVPIAEQELQAMWRTLDDVLPGAGSVRERMAALMERLTLPPERTGHVVPLMEQLLAQARQRTHRLVALPPGEVLELHTVREKSYGAANWYLGTFRSRLELNLDRPVNLLGLVYQMCHEAYPGHHTESAIKEAHLYHGHGYMEQSMLVFGPQFVIAEGIASLAQEMIFTADELADWMQAELLPALDIAGEELPLAPLLETMSIGLLDDIGGNVVLMLEDGHSEDQVLDFLMAYLPLPEPFLRMAIQGVQSPIMRLYAFTYYQGKRLLQPLLDGPHRDLAIRRVLQEQVYPDLLTAWAATPALLVES